MYTDTKLIINMNLHDCSSGITRLKQNVKRSTFYCNDYYPDTVKSSLLDEAWQKSTKLLNT